MALLTTDAANRVDSAAEAFGRARRLVSPKEAATVEALAGVALLLEAVIAELTELRAEVYRNANRT